MSTPTESHRRIRKILTADFALQNARRRLGNDGREALTDLLTDARHYADAAKIDFFEALDDSYQTYLEERAAVPRTERMIREKIEETEEGARPAKARELCRS